ncbi:MAG: hypothetical protein C5S48_06320 [Candidatus Methanogaster sp.]|nr:MAG: hypothetical protein C5S48_06320 [ANME-2 cluster archaeon]
MRQTVETTFGIVGGLFTTTAGGLGAAFEVTGASEVVGVLRVVGVWTNRLNKATNLLTEKKV